MKTYPHPSLAPTLFRIALILLWFIPLHVGAADDCKTLYHEAKKYEKEVTKQADVTDKAAQALEQARATLDEARQALHAFDHPSDETSHGTNLETERKKLEKAVADADKKLQQAKSDYYDALVELIKRLKELDKKLLAAETQCAKELAETDRQSTKDKLEKYQTELDALRDKHNLEEREGEPKEPENTQKKKDELVQQELEALLKAIREAAKTAHPEPGDYRDALRQKIREIIDEWKGDFWDTPLGRLLKERLKKALQEEIDRPAGSSTDPAEAPETPKKPTEESRIPIPRNHLGAIPHTASRQIGIGFSFGMESSAPSEQSWCYPAGEDRTTLVTTTSANLTTSSGPSDLSSVAGSTRIESVTTVSDPEAPEALLVSDCPEMKAFHPSYGLFLEIPLGRSRSIRLGGQYGTQSIRHMPIVVRSIHEDGQVSFEKLESRNRIQQLDLSTVVRQYFGSNSLRPFVGAGGFMSTQNRKIAPRQGNRNATIIDLPRSRYAGFYAETGLNIKVIRKMDLGLAVQWRASLFKNSQNISQGIRMQFTWRL